MKLNLSFLVFVIEYSASLEFVPANISDILFTMLPIPRPTFQLFSTEEALELTRDSLDS